MSITKSYNRKTNTFYVYETSYEWDDAQQKKIRKHRCIGKIDPTTGETVPTGKRGRPSGRTNTMKILKLAPPKVKNSHAKEIRGLRTDIELIRDLATTIVYEANELERKLDEFLTRK